MSSLKVKLSSVISAFVSKSISNESPPSPSVAVIELETVAIALAPSCAP